MRTRLGETRLQPGDVLLLQGDRASIAAVLPRLGCLPLAQREVTFIDLGLDSTGGLDEQSTERLLTVVVEGPGTFEVRVSDVSFGRVRVCTWRGDATTVSDRQCEQVAARN